MKEHRLSLRRRTLANVFGGIAIGALVATCATAPSGDSPNKLQNALSQAGQMFSATPAFARVAGYGDVSIADVAEGAVDSVVNISATRLVDGGQMNPFFEDPFFREFFGQPGGQPGNRGRGRAPREYKQPSLGSGVIVSADGIILTNNHVVEKSKDIQVTLADGRELDAEVVGADPKSDLAVIKVKDKAGGLKPLPIGSSADMRLGDVVLAIGNPFGVGQTVTMGIVSAKGRSQMGIVDFEDFIQTDAAINPGNSGGALINMRGELIGINTAILSRSGGYQGVGFAIPTDMAKPIMDSLVTDGRVSRGFLGVSIQDLNAELASGLGLKVQKGVLISDVMPDSPAAKGGIQRGDVVVKLNGEAVDNSSRFRNRVAATKPNTSVALTVIRDGAEKSLNVKLGQLGDEAVAKSEVEGGAGVLSGLRVADLSGEARMRFEVPDSVKSGVVVLSVQPDSAVAEAGVRPGDVILEINRRKVESASAFEKLSEASAKSDSAVLLVARGDSTLYVVVRK